MFLKKLFAAEVDDFGRFFPTLAGGRKRDFSEAERVEIQAIRDEWKAQGTDHFARPYGPDLVWALRAMRPRGDGLLSFRTSAKLRAWINAGIAFPTFGTNNDPSMATEAVRAGIRVIYGSGWQLAFTSKDGRRPDMSLYDPSEGATRVRQLNGALEAAAQVQRLRGDTNIDWEAPIIMDAEAGFGHFLNLYDLVIKAIDAGAAAVHIEDQGILKRCGHLGEKAVVPIREMILRLIAARLAADVAGVPLVIVARTDSQKARVISNPLDPRDAAFLDGTVRTSDMVWGFRGGDEAVIARLIAFAPYADLLWAETEHPDLAEYLRYIAAVKAVCPSAKFAYNCSPSFDEWHNNAKWEALNPGIPRREFIQRLIDADVLWPFITLAGIHMAGLNAFQLAQGFLRDGMQAYGDLVQGPEFALARDGYVLHRHQQVAGVPTYDAIASGVTAGVSEMLAGATSTEARFRSREGVGGGEPPAKG